ncbi:MAG: hypothetical protein FWF98_05895, partial [Dehalococcoidia bacterium]|nr:hypothetical protein [Dehalococcoidia bacterium]
MDNFRRKIVDRVLLHAVWLIITCGAMLYLLQQVTTRKRNDPYWNVNIGQVQLIIVASIIIILGYSVTKYIMAIRDPERLKRLYISETDERNILIKQKTDSVGMSIVMYVVAIAAAIAGNDSEPVFYTLLFTLVFVTLVHLLLK